MDDGRRLSMEIRQSRAHVLRELASLCLTTGWIEKLHVLCQNRASEPLQDESNLPLLRLDASAIEQHDVRMTEVAEDAQLLRNVEHVLQGVACRSKQRCLHSHWSAMVDPGHHEAEPPSAQDDRRHATHFFGWNEPVLGCPQLTHSLQDLFGVRLVVDTEELARWRSRRQGRPGLLMGPALRHLLRRNLSPALGQASQRPLGHDSLEGLPLDDLGVPLAQGRDHHRDEEDRQVHTLVHQRNRHAQAEHRNKVAQQSHEFHRPETQPTHIDEKVHR
mmetsp:Transcript_120510/g.384763  ORF Transcript_120510/g.384763 Transcript_120510/m.384763 type:complete len:275 (+) Transcript_120510:970-1794(+)